jgi:GMP reductase
MSGRIIEDIKLDFKDVLIRPKRSTLKSRNEVSLEVRYTFKHSKQQWSGVPIIAANMDTVGTFEMASELSKFKIITAIHKHYTLDEWIEFTKKNFNEGLNPTIFDYIAISSGISKDDFTKLCLILDRISFIKMICIDVANGYAEQFVEFIKKCRSQYPNHTIIAGNVVTAEMTEELILSGADIVKIGIGPGSVCTTRKKTGVGYPQLSAIIECADAARGLGGFIVSDGGCTVPGDLAKAFGAGAQFVMLGGMFAGHEESGGETIEINGKKYKEFYGMSSSTAMIKHVGQVAEYRASEGKHVRVPFKGSIKNTVIDILGGIRSACTYVGSGTLKDLHKRTTFIRVSQQTNEVFTPFNSE